MADIPKQSNFWGTASSATAQPRAQRMTSSQPGHGPSFNPSSASSSHSPAAQPLSQTAPATQTTPTSPSPFIPPQTASHAASGRSHRTRTPRSSIFAFRAPSGERTRLYSGKRDRDKLDDLASVFSLLTATERLENMWARRGAISQEDYEVQCDKLIQQYAVLRVATETSIPNLDLFIAEYDCKASMARPRLKAGVPATVALPRATAKKSKDLGRYVMRCTNIFNQVVLCIDLHQLEVHYLQPDLTTLMKTLSHIKGLGHDLEFATKIGSWVEKLNSMHPSDRLSEEDAALLKHELNNGFQDFESEFVD